MKILAILMVLLVIIIVGISGCTNPDNSTSNTTPGSSDPNIETYKQNLVNLQENPKAYVGQTVTIVGSRGFSFKKEANPTLGTPEGTEIMMGDSEKVGASTVSIWYTGPPIDLDLFSNIKVTGTFKRNSDYKYGLSDYVIVTDKVEGIK
ncbi:MAG: hypothetical protein PQ968_03915 [Methanobacterium sp.]